MRFDLSDEEWALLEPLFPKNRKSSRVDDRKILNAIFYVLRTGMPWRDLPERYAAPTRPPMIGSIGGLAAASGNTSLTRWPRDHAMVCISSTARYKSAPLRQ